jgi:hypothetical protein
VHLSVPVADRDHPSGLAGGFDAQGLLEPQPAALTALGVARGCGAWSGFELLRLLAFTTGRRLDLSVPEVANWQAALSVGLDSLLPAGSRLGLAGLLDLMVELQDSALVLLDGLCGLGRPD